MLNSCDTIKAEYRCGDTIGLYLRGDSSHSLDANDFKAVFYSDLEEDIVISKAEMVKQEDNLYKLTIGNEITTDLQPGKFTIEVLFGDTETSILESFAFNLKDSHAKNYLP